MSELGNIANLLLSKSEAGKVEWNVEPAKDSFSTVVDGVIMRIRYRTFSNTTAADYYFSIRSKDDHEIESYYQEAKHPDYSLLKKLYEIARRRALRVDETLSKVERALKGL